jgi:hypothetical protein
VADGNRGRLIAIDGSDGGNILAAALTLQKALSKRQAAGGISRWDASGLFSDVASASPEKRDVSPRTVVLLYAADLAFRLRWEIEPALERGSIVVAAPYVTTAITFGLATGLSSEWLRTLFRFAPMPIRTAVLREGKAARPWKQQTYRGFGECCAALLKDTPAGFARRKTQAKMRDALSSAAEKHGGLFRPRDLRDLGTELTRQGTRRVRTS